MQTSGRSNSDIRAPFESRLPSRGELWEEGSYYDLERCLDAMRQPYPKISRHLIAFYVDATPPKWARKVYAEKGVELLMRFMPSNVFVPQEISENAGFLPSDAKVAARPRRVAA